MSGPAGAQRASTHLRTILAALWELVKLQRKTLILAIGLMSVSRLASLILPGSMKYLIDDVIGKGNYRILMPLVLAVLAATIFQAASTLALNRAITLGSQELIATMRQKAQNHAAHLPLKYFDSTNAGQVVSRIMNDIQGVQNLVGNGLIQFLGGLLAAAMASVVMYRISPSLTLLAAAFMISFGVLVSLELCRVRPIYRDGARINGEIRGRLTEFVAGIRIIKGYHTESHEGQVFSIGLRELMANARKSLNAVSVMTFSSTALVGTIGAIVMLRGALEIRSGVLTLGGFVTFTTFLAQLTVPVYQVVGVGTQFAQAVAGLERIQELLSQPAEDADPRRTMELGRIRGDVRLDGVRFSYTPGIEVLHDISFAAPAGTVTALVGRSGSGKSTAVNLIASFYPPTAGEIFVDGVDLATVSLGSFRSQIGLVTQDTFLFSGTIRENICYGRPNTTADQISEACRVAHVDEFLARLEKGLDTEVGERGLRLSGGQRQRIAIARAVVVDPRILILDEATSSLDFTSEAIVRDGLVQLMKGRTTFVVAHRLSTIQEADQILMMENGRIVERGTHSSLCAAGGAYRSLYTAQLRAGTEDDLDSAVAAGA